MIPLGSFSSLINPREKLLALLPVFLVFVAEGFEEGGLFDFYPLDEADGDRDDKDYEGEDVGEDQPHPPEGDEGAGIGGVADEAVDAALYHLMALLDDDIDGEVFPEGQYRCPPYRYPGDHHC